MKNGPGAWREAPADFAGYIREQRTAHISDIVASPLLDVRNLSVSYATPSGSFRALQDISFSLQAGETLAIIGETGCGKTTLALSILGLLSGGQIEGGSICFDGESLTGAGEREWRQVRGCRIGMVFQDPRASLNPVLRIGDHLSESMRAHNRMSGSQARNTGIRLLAELGIPDPAFVLRRYPSELSGGTCQRIGIALAICNNPALLIADEPTGALDPTIQSQIMSLLKDMKRLRGLSLLFISHDLLLISDFADRAAVMYGGRIVELGPAEEVLAHPTHPYTRGLAACIPDIRRTPGSQRLHPIPGFPAGRTEVSAGCVFLSRCELAGAQCAVGAPDLIPVADGHQAACIMVAPGSRA